MPRGPLPPPPPPPPGPPPDDDGGGGAGGPCDPHVFPNRDITPTKLEFLGWPRYTVANVGALVQNQRNTRIVDIDRYYGMTPMQMLVQAWSDSVHDFLAGERNKKGESNTIKAQMPRILFDMFRESLNYRDFRKIDERRPDYDTRGPAILSLYNNSNHNDITRIFMEALTAEAKARGRSPRDIHVLQSDIEDTIRDYFEDYCDLLARPNPSASASHTEILDAAERGDPIDILSIRTENDVYIITPGERRLKTFKPAEMRVIGEFILDFLFGAHEGFLAQFTFDTAPAKVGNVFKDFENVCSRMLIQCFTDSATSSPEQQFGKGETIWAAPVNVLYCRDKYVEDGTKFISRRNVLTPEFRISYESFGFGPKTPYNFRYVIEHINGAKASFKFDKDQRQGPSLNYLLQAHIAMKGIVDRIRGVAGANINNYIGVPENRTRIIKDLRAALRNLPVQSGCLRVADFAVGGPEDALLIEIFLSLYHNRSIWEEIKRLGDQDQGDGVAYFTRLGGKGVLVTIDRPLFLLARLLGIPCILHYKDKFVLSKCGLAERPPTEQERREFYAKKLKKFVTNYSPLYNTLYHGRGFLTNFLDTINVAALAAGWPKKASASVSTIFRPLLEFRLREISAYLYKILETLPSYPLVPVPGDNEPLDQLIALSTNELRIRIRLGEFAKIGVTPDDLGDIAKLMITPATAAASYVSKAVFKVVNAPIAGVVRTELVRKDHAKKLAKLVNEAAVSAVKAALMAPPANPRVPPFEPIVQAADLAAVPEIGAAPLVGLPAQAVLLLPAQAVLADVALSAASQPGATAVSVRDAVTGAVAAYTAINTELVTAAAAAAPTTNDAAILAAVIYGTITDPANSTRVGAIKEWLTAPAVPGGVATIAEIAAKCAAVRAAAPAPAAPDIFPVSDTNSCATMCRNAVGAFIGSNPAFNVIPVPIQDKAVAFLSTAINNPAIAASSASICAAAYQASRNAPLSNPFVSPIPLPVEDIVPGVDGVTGAITATIGNPVEAIKTAARDQLTGAGPAVAADQMLTTPADYYAAVTGAANPLRATASICLAAYNAAVSIAIAQDVATAAAARAAIGPLILVAGANAVAATFVATAAVAVDTTVNIVNLVLWALYAGRSILNTPSSAQDAIKRVELQGNIATHAGVPERAADAAAAAAALSAFEARAAATAPTRSIIDSINPPNIIAAAIIAIGTVKASPNELIDAVSKTFMFNLNTPYNEFSFSIDAFNTALSSFIAMEGKITGESRGRPFDFLKLIEEYSKNIVELCDSFKDKDKAEAYKNALVMPQAPPDPPTLIEQHSINYSNWQESINTKTGNKTSNLAIKAALVAAEAAAKTKVDASFIQAQTFLRSQLPVIVAPLLVQGGGAYNSDTDVDIMIHIEPFIRRLCQKAADYCNNLFSSLFPVFLKNYMFKKLNLYLKQIPRFIANLRSWNVLPTQMEKNKLMERCEKLIEHITSTTKTLAGIYDGELYDLLNKKKKIYQIYDGMINDIIMENERNEEEDIAALLAAVIAEEELAPPALAAAGPLAPPPPPALAAAGPPPPALAAAGPLPPALAAAGPPPAPQRSKIEIYTEERDKYRENADDIMLRTLLGEQSYLGKLVTKIAHEKLLSLLIALLPIKEGIKNASIQAAWDQGRARAAAAAAYTTINNDSIPAAKAAVVAANTAAVGAAAAAAAAKSAQPMRSIRDIRSLDRNVKIRTADVVAAKTQLATLERERAVLQSRSSNETLAIAISKRISDEDEFKELESKIQSVRDSLSAISLTIYTQYKREIDNVVPILIRNYTDILTQIEEKRVELGLDPIPSMQKELFDLTKERDNLLLNINSYNIFMPDYDEDEIAAILAAIIAAEDEGGGGDDDEDEEGGGGGDDDEDEEGGGGGGGGGNGGGGNGGGGNGGGGGGSDPIDAWLQLFRLEWPSPQVCIEYLKDGNENIHTELYTMWFEDIATLAEEEPTKMAPPQAPPAGVSKRQLGAPAAAEPPEPAPLVPVEIDISRSEIVNLIKALLDPFKTVLDHTRNLYLNEIPGKRTPITEAAFASTVASATSVGLSADYVMNNLVANPLFTFKNNHPFQKARTKWGIEGVTFPANFLDILNEAESKAIPAMLIALSLLNDIINKDIGKETSYFINMMMDTDIRKNALSYDLFDPSRFQWGISKLLEVATISSISGRISNLALINASGGARKTRRRRTTGRRRTARR